MRTRLSLNAIQAFEVAARLGSFVAAASELNLTPSAVSHQIRSLEERLNIKLFNRVNRGVVLTEAGLYYAEVVRRGLGTIDAATRELKYYDKGDILTIHCVPSLASQWLMPRLSRFSALYPDINIRLNASANRVDLVAEEADVDIRYGPIHPESGISVTPFPKEPLAVMCAPNLTEGRHPINAPEDLQHHTLIHSDVNLITWQAWFRQREGRELELKMGPRFDRSFMAISAAVDGLGVILENRLLAEREIANRTLILPLGTETPTLTFHRLLYLESKANFQKITAFKKWIFEQLSESFERLHDAE